MITNPDYAPRTLIQAFDEGPLVHTFLRDTFFGGREYPPTANIEFDFRRGRRKMAPFVAPLIGGKIMERQGFETRFFKAPRIAPVRALRTPDLEPRLFGDNIYSGTTEADRAAALLAEDSEFLDEAISRREEWMCREVLINGKITVTAENGYQQVINFLEYGSTGQFTSNHFLAANLKAGTWDTPASDPLADLEAARLNTIKVSGISPNVALFGTNAKSAFINNAQVQKLLDNRRFEMGTVAPIIQDDAVVRFGTVPGLELYTYAEYFEDDAGALFPMLPPDLVMILSTNVQNKIVYGAYTQLEDAKAGRWVTYQAARIPFAYGDEGGNETFYRLTSCPLPMPADILGICIIEALPGGVGPFAFKAKKGGDDEGTDAEPQPFFEADQGVPEAAEGNEYESKTVAELKDEASNRGVEIPSDARKADIIAALKAADGK